MHLNGYIFSFFIISLSTNFVFAVQSLPTKSQVVKLVLEDCERDEFKRYICTPPTQGEVFIEYRLEISKDKTKLSLKNASEDTLINIKPLINIAPEAKLDEENILWILAGEEQNQYPQALVYREFYEDSENQSRVSVLRLSNSNSCLIGVFESGRLGPEVDLIENAIRLAQANESVDCL